MESEEALSRTCKSLLPPSKDQDALQNRTSPHLSSDSSHEGKGKESATTVRKDGPLHLLNLPLDILKDIFKEVSICKRRGYLKESVLTAPPGHTYERFV